MRRTLHGLGLACAVFVAGATPGAIAASDVDAAFKKFWDARNPGDAAKAGHEIAASGVAFDEAFTRLRRGRVYSTQVKRGAVPDTYDPARRYPVRFQLHGGVMMRETGEPRTGPGGRGGSPTLEGNPDQIYVMPTSWRDAPWWSRVQIENLDAILDRLKRTYNVDENRVALAGVSDGATGLYYVAMRDTTPFSSFLPLNGSLMVLANDRLGVEGELFPTNLRNKPLFVVNGGQDPLYPMRSVEPYVAHLDSSGVEIEYHPRPEAGHNTAWWPEMKEPFEAFVHKHPRITHPATLTWEAGDRDLPSRAHWLVIERVSPSASEAHLQPDLNVFSGPGLNHGRELFARARPSARVDLVRRGNTVTATARGVAEFTLLLSPDEFDFSKPVTVTVNGRTLVERQIEPTVATLLKWAARDNDRTMRYGTEVHLVPAAAR